MQAIATAHVTSRGGNALIAYRVKQCFVIENPHKNQGQCLLALQGDTVQVSYGDTACVVREGVRLPTAPGKGHTLEVAAQLASSSPLAPTSQLSCSPPSRRGSITAPKPGNNTGPPTPRTISVEAPEAKIGAGETAGKPPATIAVPHESIV